MKRLTLKTVNKAVAAAGLKHMTLYQGNGYLYFWGDGVENQSYSVMVCRLNHLDLARWLDEAREAAGDLADVGAYTRIKNPCNAELYSLRHHTESAHPVSILRKTYTVNVEVADKGCFVDGHRRVFEVVKKGGTINIGGFGRSSTTEVICWAATEKAAIAQATKTLGGVS